MTEVNVHDAPDGQVLLEIEDVRKAFRGRRGSRPSGSRRSTA